MRIILQLYLFVYFDIAFAAPFNSSLSITSQIRWFLPYASTSQFNTWEVTKVVALCAVFLPGWWLVRRKQKESKDGKSLSASSEDEHVEGAYPMDLNDAEVSDPGLLKKHSEFKQYNTSRFTYPKIRVFFRPHPQITKLPKDPSPLPLLVFIHGLGGSVAQFHPLLTSLVNNSSCLAIDLPGAGLSSFAPKLWEAYTTQSLAELLEIIIEAHRDNDARQGVVLVGHSMGCSLAAMIASRNSRHYTDLLEHVVGLVAICPKAEPPTEADCKKAGHLLSIPGPIFNAWRRWDRRGGAESASVLRFVGEDADEQTRKLQYRFNEQSRTEVWRRMARGALPQYKDEHPGGLPGAVVWAGLEVPVFLVAGEADHITTPTEVEKISAFLGKSHTVQIEVDEESTPITDAAAPISSSFEHTHAWPRDISSIGLEDFTIPDPETIEDAHEDPSTPNDDLSIIPPQPSKPTKVLKTTILPSPASHALIYQPAQVRILAGLISDFLCSQVSPRLSLGWQLQFLSTSGKWDVKNLEKWSKVRPLSEPIAGVFRAMKTLREVDETHCPEVFVQQWGSQVKDIIDISHENPVYDPKGFRSIVHYHKYGTVSKIPPTGDEVTGFIALVDRLREEQRVRAEKEGWTEKCYIGVHCHYGFNRTGYFLVCYLVERLGYDVQAAIDEFAKKRPKGIKHAHFLDQLFVRYCHGLN